MGESVGIRRIFGDYHFVSPRSLVNPGKRLRFQALPGVTPFLRREPLLLDDEEEITLGCRDDVEVLGD